MTFLRKLSEFEFEFQIFLLHQRPIHTIYFCTHFCDKKRHFSSNIFFLCELKIFVFGQFCSIDAFLSKDCVQNVSCNLGLMLLSSTHCDQISKIGLMFLDQGWTNILVRGPFQKFFGPFGRHF